MDSFYGGRQGKPFIIVKTFNTVSEMTDLFNTGAAYTEVNYGEYVLINTKDSRNLENGRLYRRGLAGAEYIGKIVGPEGFPPQLTLDDYADIKNELPENGHSHLYKEGEYLPSQDEEGNLVSGKTHNSIKWRINSARILTKRNINNHIIITNEDGSFNHLEDDNGNIVEATSEEEKVEYTSAYETTVYVGFQVPYPFFESEASSISPYDNRKKDDNENLIGIDYVDLVNQETVPLEDGSVNPFHHKFTFKIPHGVRGDSIANVRALTSAFVQYNLPIAGRYSALPEEIQESFIKGGITYNYKYVFEGGGEGTENLMVRLSLGVLYRARLAGASNLSLESDVLIEKISPTYIIMRTQNSIEASYAPYYIEVNAQEVGNIPEDYIEGQQILVGDIYNYDFSAEGSYATYFLSYFNDLDYIDISEIGVVSIHYTAQDKHELEQKVKWINSLNLSEDGIVTINYNTAETQSLNQPLTWITEATLEDYNLKVALNRPVSWAKDKDGNQVSTPQDFTYLGNVRNDVGVYIELTLTEGEIISQGIAEQETYLNETYPNGIVNGFGGRLIAIGGSDSNKRLYAFTFKDTENVAGWHYIGTVLSGSVDVIGADVGAPNLVAGQVAFVAHAAPVRANSAAATMTTDELEDDPYATLIGEGVSNE